LLFAECTVDDAVAPVALGKKRFGERAIVRDGDARATFLELLDE
jgi:hypothetical protein